ncbi:plantaricin C family lantibiotic [Hazenella sp. IB182357]|uniref:Plantaricin C family lantibiotic n=1 Tax=Polycladospora coralii TaxID=2771432 RepID=A0A926RTT4_9BACL|nr:plantaricin C family lantibiotic [Polycladospora coralii]MBD1372088.1 plantaricin C family lantibiotic [Polycladospora coralii]
MKIREVIKSWKDPVFRSKQVQTAHHPSGDTLQELSDLELAAVVGASDVPHTFGNLCHAASKYVGNQGFTYLNHKK